VSPTVGLDVLEKRRKFLAPTGIRTPDRPGSQKMEAAYSYIILVHTRKTTQ
jgi:hypothetical protein